MQDPDDRAAARLPSTRTSVTVAAAAVAVIALSWWLATRDGAPDAQEAVVRWLNDPPQPVAAVLALSNPLGRPWGLGIVAAALLVWVWWSLRSRRARLQAALAGAVGFLLAEAVAQVLKRVAEEPRPLAVFPDLQVHGYPRTPIGNAYPSAHTAVTVALVASLWPWMTRAQRVVGVVVAVLVALNRVYIAAHWPLDLVGGAAIGVLAGAGAWLVCGWWGQRRAAMAPAGGPAERGPAERGPAERGSAERGSAGGGGAGPDLAGGGPGAAGGGPDVAGGGPGATPAR